MGVFAIRPQHQGCFLLSARTSDQDVRLTNRLVLVLSPPVLAYYNGLSLVEGYNHLIDVVTQSEFAMLAVMSSFMLPARDSFNLQV